jgi:hypothetical protein
MRFVGYQYRKSPFDDQIAMSQSGGVNERMERDGDGVCHRDSLVNVPAHMCYGLQWNSVFFSYFACCVDILSV